MNQFKPYLLPCFLFTMFIALLSGLRYYSSLNHIPYDIKDAIKTCNVVPVVIIGGGPAGLSASIYITRFGIPCLLFDEIYLQPAKDIYCDPDWIGFDHGEFGERVLEMRKQTVNLGTTLVNCKIKSVDLSVWPFILKDEKDRSFRAMAVIIATGSHNKKPNSAIFKEQIQLTSDGYIQLQKRMYSTSRSGVFAAGSVYAECAHPIIVASQGASAAIDTKVFLYEIGYSNDIQRILHNKQFVSFD